ncbi:ATP-NAD kinase family protein [Proteiniborus sp.]|uniref:ATP-NAD kinase family protein n=1 Tax=Proteiniborus sp. TaxID=2079015 RepID=UPI003327A988
MKKLGLIVNPVAGMGGSVGLKGSDGLEILMKARELGAVPQASNRTKQALEELSSLKDQIEIITYPGEMGENVTRNCGFNPTVIGLIDQNNTTPQDTQNAALDMKKLGVDLILFAGGDGTARNIYDAVNVSIPVLGIPAGVKIHSAVYGQNPKRAGELAKLFLQDKVVELREVEVMDIDEDAFRDERVVARLYGYLKAPFEKKFVQKRKSGGVAGEKAALTSMANYIINTMLDDYIYIIGPGTTTRSIMERLGLNNTLLGVDVVYKKQLIAKDVTEKELLKIIDGKKAKIIVTIIGGQGYIFGRGNQQLSPAVINQIQKDNVIVVASRNKLNTIFGSPMLIDTGNNETNNMLEGYYRVVVGYEDFIMYKAKA